MMETMRKQRPALVVINDELMDNHQAEVAVALRDGGHIAVAHPSTILAQLEVSDLDNQKPYPASDPSLFASFLDDAVGP